MKLNADPRGTLFRCMTRDEFFMHCKPQLPQFETGKTMVLHYFLFRCYDVCHLKWHLTWYLAWQKQSETLAVLISSGLPLQWLGAGLGFPARDWAGSQQCKHQVRATRPVVSDTGPGPSALQKRIPTEMESSEASKVFSGRKREQCM